MNKEYILRKGYDEIKTSDDRRVITLKALDYEIVSIVDYSKTVTK